MAALHGPALRAGLEEAGFAVAAEVEVRPGEASKDFATLHRVLEELLAAGIDRRTAVVALGGGVVGDLAGFAAAVALRGLPFVQVPTTLLAQVDSSVGGKTGVNLAVGKNLAGAFHQPRIVLADTATLRTLPPRELRAGYAEVAKHGLLAGEAFWDWCESGGGEAAVAGDAAALSHAVVESCRLKAAVVAADEREEAAEGGRALLNLGHTFGHALEAECGYDGTLLHGEGVAVGLGLAAALSARLGHCAQELPGRIISHLAACGLPARIGDLPRPFSAAALMERMRRDKKVRDGRLRFVLLRAPGDVFTASDVPAEAVEALLRTRARGVRRPCMPTVAIDPGRDALIAMDVQPDFMPGGALPVPEGDAVVPVINRLLDLFAVYVATQDWHPAGHFSFASSHPGAAPFSRVMAPYGEQTLWPDHCLQGTPGAALHPDLRTEPFRAVCAKGGGGRWTATAPSSRTTAGR